MQALCFLILCFHLVIGMYIVQNEYINPNVWIDKLSGQTLEVCQRDPDTLFLGKQKSLTNIYWERTYSLPASTRLDIYIEYHISGIWNNQKLEVYANNILMKSLTITLNDQNRDCKSRQKIYYCSFLYEYYMYFVVSSNLNTLQLTFRTYSTDQGMYIKNVVINQKTQHGRNNIIPFLNQVKTCTSSSLEQISYYCQCPNELVFQVNHCQPNCDQNYLYDPQQNECFFKSNCQACAGKNAILQCDQGMFKYQELNASISNCLERCPQDYYEDIKTMTCLNMQTYLQIFENNGSIYQFQLDIVDHYFFYKSTADFFHFFQYNDFITSCSSVPAKVSERNFIFHKGIFVAGSYEPFQSQSLELNVILKHSQYKLRFRAIGHFIDFYPTRNQVLINGVKQPSSLIISSQENEQKNNQDYITYYDYYWTRTELHPVSYNSVIFLIEQPLQNGVYQGYFYLEDIHIYQFRCVEGCSSCYNSEYCSPCLNPANKNPDNCSCLTGYIMKKDICVGIINFIKVCPTYCSYCTIENQCDSCLATTKRINPPLCNTCPEQYYLKIDQDNCQNCQLGCRLCNDNEQCNNCLQGYYKNSDLQCITQCIDGQFNDISDINNPICSQCSNNCLKCQNSATFCTSCSEQATLIDNVCYSCPDGSYLENKSCLPCISNCQQCTSLTCLKCSESYFYRSTIGQCVSICDSNYYGSITTRTCEKCDGSCLTCQDKTLNDCLSCPKGTVLNLANSISGSCQTNCLAKYYKINDYCVKCWKGCQSCMDASQACLTCASGYYRHKINDFCYEQCPDGFYNNKNGNVCSICDSTCKTCSDSIKCTTCQLPLAYFQSKCLEYCPEGYGNSNALCVTCTPNCKSCFGTAPNQCAVCNQGFYFLKNQCYFKCPTFFIGIRPQYVCKCIYDNCVSCTAVQFFSNNKCYEICPQGTFGYNGLCINCSLQCETCFGEDEQSCLSCLAPLILSENSCVTECQGATFHDTNKNECLNCDISCLACNGPNICTACQDFLTEDGRCVDECSSNEYAILSEKKCLKCDSSCLTCFGGSYNNCLTCNNLFYLYECVDNCPDGFILSGNQLSCVPDFQIVIAQCTFQCLTCELIPRFCTSCSGNRLNNPPNCDCENGYYDDGLHSICQACSNKCETCTHQLDICITCKGNRILPNCNCPKNYYDDGFSVNCQKCQDNCATCSSEGCITCLNNRIQAPDCVCPDGYYEAYQLYCIECAKKCLTCVVSDQVCLYCSTIRVNPPICNCPTGYFENSDYECQECNPICVECDVSGCLTCSGNRVGPNEGLCTCSTPGVSRLSIGSVFCTDCNLGVPYFGLNDDFNGFTIDFGSQVKIVNEHFTDLCALIFLPETLLKLGDNPQCNDDLSVLFGDNPTIKVNDKLNLRTEFLYFGYNPYYITEGFPKNSSGYQAVDPQIVLQNSTVTKNLSQPMLFEFPKYKELSQNISLKCIAQVDATHWDAGVCKTSQKNGQTICECQNLNPTSVMESLDYILDKAADIYSSDTLLAFGSFPFYKTFIFYFYIIITGSYIFLIVWGMKIDNRMFNKHVIENIEIIQCEPKQTPQYTFQKTIFKSTNKKIVRFLEDKNEKPVSANIIHLSSKQSIENSPRGVQEYDLDHHQIQSQFSTSPKILFDDQAAEILEKCQSEGNVKQNNQKISKYQAYVEYLKFFHQILSIIYKDDESKPRALRATIVYSSIMGSLTVLFVFNQPNNLSLTITLALITAPLNKIYQIILEKLLTHQKRVIRTLGGVLMLIFMCLISYTMLAGLMLSGSVEAVNQWSIIFVSSFSLDNLIYSPMQLILQYCIHIGLINFPKLQQLLHKFLDEKGKQFLKEILSKTGLS